MIFQTESEVVRNVYSNNPNCKIIYKEEGENDFCAIYFASHNIYYPNREDIFRERIVEKNSYEWFHTRIERASKHIYLRDVFKQWYLEGINTELNTPEKLVAWLRKETEGYRVVTVGSSAGGYAAILYGSLLGAEMVLAFSPQLSMQSVLDEGRKQTNPLAFKYEHTERNKYYSLKPFLKDEVKYFYFFPAGSVLDKKQYHYIYPSGNSNEKPSAQFYCLKFGTSHHGIPFPKVALPRVINLSSDKLQKLSIRVNNPLWFSIKMAGVAATVRGVYKQLSAKLKVKK